MSSSSSSSASAATEDDRTKGRGNRTHPQGGDERVYDHSPKLRGRKGAEKVYELLSKTRTDKTERDRSVSTPVAPPMDRQTSTPGEGGAIYAKPKRHAPPPPGTGGASGGKKVAGPSPSSFEVQISEGPPDYSAVTSSRQKDVCDYDPHHAHIS